MGEALPVQRYWVEACIEARTFLRSERGSEVHCRRLHSVRSSGRCQYEGLRCEEEKVGREA